MYVPNHFRMPDNDIQPFLHKVQTGNLITVDPSSGLPIATFLPWAVVDDDRLTSHIGKVNPQVLHQGPALVILMGHDHYVSQQWLAPGKAPSWNYETAHLYGDLIIHSDPEWIIQSFDDLMQRFSDVTITDYDHDWLEVQAHACYGVEFRITDIQAKSKLSQNRSNREVRVIADHLEPLCPHLAARMREVSLPHSAAREERVDNAIGYRLT